MRKKTPAGPCRTLTATERRLRDAGHLRAATEAELTEMKKWRRSIRDGGASF
jgi:hypothetical protein